MKTKKKQQQGHRTKQHRAKPPKKKFNPVKTFFRIVISIVGIFLLLTGGAAFAYYKVTGESPFGHAPDIEIASDMNIVDALLKRNIKMNVAVMGTDKEGKRTDVMFVVHYDSAKESIDLLSVPRDTRVAVCSEVAENYRENRRSYNQVTKLNGIHSYSKKEDACKNTVLQMEDLLGIKIDHYVKINLDAFRKIVDTVGGVEVDVPQDMYYSDPVQDLYIDLKAGVQTLDGDTAEQLVRFRKYPTGDVGRIQVQQLFMKAMAEKVLSSESVLKNLPGYIKVLYEDVETDISLGDAMKYVNYIKKVDMNKITMQTLPGEGRTISGISYFIHNPVETEEMVDEIFYQSNTAEEKFEGSDSKGLTIEVANGGTINGLAGKYTDILAEAGYQMGKPSTYMGEQISQTRIQVRKKGMGEDLAAYFKDAKVKTAPDLLDEGVDIRIILGTGES